MPHLVKLAAKSSHGCWDEENFESSFGTKLQKVLTIFIDNLVSLRPLDFHWVIDPRQWHWCSSRGNCYPSKKAGDNWSFRFRPCIRGSSSWFQMVFIQLDGNVLKIDRKKTHFDG